MKAYKIKYKIEFEVVVLASSYDPDVTIDEIKIYESDVSAVINAFESQLELEKSTVVVEVEEVEEIVIPDNILASGPHK